MTVTAIKKQYFVAAGIFLLLVVLNIGGFWFFLRPGLPANTFGGKVVTVTDHTLLVVDAHGRTEQFTIASSTKIVFGKKDATETELAAGVFVMVSTESHKPAATATKIRIMSTDPFVRPHKTPTP
jgi:hypothetical protein